MRSYHRKSPGSGSTFGVNSGYVRTSVALDAETFAQVRAIAIREGTSVRAALRDLIEWGLADDDEAQASRRRA